MIRRIAPVLILALTSCSGHVYTARVVVPDDSPARRQAISAWVIAHGYGLEYHALPDGSGRSEWTEEFALGHHLRFVLSARRAAGDLEDALTVRFELDRASNQPELIVEGSTWILSEGVRHSQTVASDRVQQDAEALIAAFQPD